MHIWTQALMALLTLAYPALIYFGLGHFEPRYLALLLASLALVRAIATRDRVWLAAAAGAAVLGMVALVANEALPLKLYPALVNAVMLLVFGSSLKFGPPVVERLARLREGNLPPHAIAYTRTVTQIWCLFFVVNGSLALWTALAATDEVWALYNGLLAYLLMGLLFAVEWLVRQRVRARHG